MNLSLPIIFFSGANGKFVVFSFILSGYFESTSIDYPTSLSSGVFEISSNLFI